MLATCLLSLAFSASVAASGGSGSRSALPLQIGWAPLPEGGVAPMASSGPIESFGCTYTQEVDDAHISSEPPTAMSSHGWWTYVSGGCPSMANVDTYLQALWWNGTSYEWLVVGYNSGDVFAGGGSSNRVTARRTCANPNLVGWRSGVDVDLINHIDPPGITYSSPLNYNCAPS
jgi:hypothetical protein